MLAPGAIACKGRWIGQPITCVKGLQILRDGRAAKRINDNDGLTGTGVAVVQNGRQIVCIPNLLRAVARTAKVTAAKRVGRSLQRRRGKLQPLYLRHTRDHIWTVIADCLARMSYLGRARQHACKSYSRQNHAKDHGDFHGTLPAKVGVLFWTAKEPGSLPRRLGEHVTSPSSGKSGLRDLFVNRNEVRAGAVQRHPASKSGQFGSLPELTHRSLIPRSVDPEPLHLGH